MEREVWAAFSYEGNRSSVDIISEWNFRRVGIYYTIHDFNIYIYV